MVAKMGELLAGKLQLLMSAVSTTLKVLEGQGMVVRQIAGKEKPVRLFKKTM